MAQHWFQLSAILPKPKQSLVSAARILENLVPNPTAISDLSAQHINPRTGRKARRRTLPSDAPARIKTLLSTSLPHIGPKLSNNLPGKLRSLTECSVEKFKHHLDNHLQTIPDEPPVPGYTSVSRADTNSISDQVNLQHRDAGFGCSGGAPRLQAVAIPTTAASTPEVLLVTLLLEAHAVPGVSSSHTQTENRL
ncbi:hypothetical protein GWK47_019477 [Chionoecetes opilio]|uniref:Uncharacterized protein n=1 Tax=Chionoecetes opilio TaxID=41210 RepID=A0A8J5CI34_CHIOP|nr:hypothetical protein GWK47_019477 [Chionoecetes opilio]